MSTDKAGTFSISRSAGNIRRTGLYCLLAAAVAVLPLRDAQAANPLNSFLPSTIVSSTIPANGDLNPYGVAFVPATFPSGGTIAAGDVLVSNFNNFNNLQGTGTTIISLVPASGGPVAPSVPGGTTPGNATTFFQSSLNGLTTALGVLQRGFVVVGNVPTTDGTVATISTGALQIINKNGTLVQTLTDATIDSPWDLTIHDLGATAQIFVSNVLSGKVTRLNVSVGPSSLTVLSKTVIATGYTTAPNAAALVLGPTGLAYNPNTDVLYVASTADNAIFTIPHAGTTTHSVVKGTLLTDDSHLIGPLALGFAPNGDLLTANGDATNNADPLHPSEIVEFTPTGQFVTEVNVDAGQGGAFGLATVLTAVTASTFGNFNYAFIDDVANSLTVTHISPINGL